MTRTTTLEMRRGDAREITITLTLDGEPWTIPDGATVRATAKYSASDADDSAVWTKSTTDGGITVDGDVATITLTADDTSALAHATVLHCDCQVAGAGYGPWTVAVWQLTVLPDITRTVP